MRSGTGPAELDPHRGTQERMPVVRCRRCGAVASAHLGTEKIETSYGASFREHCRSLADRGGADFVSSITECPFMDTALGKLAMRLSRRAAGSKAEAIGWRAHSRQKKGPAGEGGARVERRSF